MTSQRLSGEKPAGMSEEEIGTPASLSSSSGANKVRDDPSLCCSVNTRLLLKYSQRLSGEKPKISTRSSASLVDSKGELTSNTPTQRVSMVCRFTASLVLVGDKASFGSLLSTASGRCLVSWV